MDGMAFLRFLGWSLLTLMAVALVSTLWALWAYRDIPAAELEARYATPASKFLNVDGVRIHYRDEGSGPPVVLIHANFASLIGWDPWVEALRDHYRVIRFDMTSHGLTGPDPSGDYTLERTIQLTERFVDALGLQRFTIGGTSLGGTVSIHYTSRHPDRIDRLILLSPGALEGRDGDMQRRGVPKAARVLEYILPRALPKFMLTSAFGDQTKLTDELIDQWHDMWLREGQREAQLTRLSVYESGDLEGTLRNIRVPVLLMWGEANPQAEVGQAFEIRALLESAPSVQMLIYPGVGHMAVQEAGAEIGQDVLAWLDGTLPAGDRIPAALAAAHAHGAE
jgi:pimeloyl-ACP methyl ester carboxylesterase